MQVIRLSRLRKERSIRDWISESCLSPKDFIQPYFLVEGKGKKEPIKSMPGVYHFSVDNLLKDVDGGTGVRAILLFGVPRVKDDLGSQAYQKNGIVQKAVKAVKKEFKDLIVMTDVCLCGYTPHGHCGIIKESKSIDNDGTLKVLGRIAVSHAEAGSDFVAPSAMMDGQVGAIRNALDKNGFVGTGILAYSAKYASNFYGPFREAAKSAPNFGDRRSYQMDYRNSDEALREIHLDIQEGADIVMVKPALAYLDVIYRAKQEFKMPIAAYNVSGEYSMLKKISSSDKNKERELVMEVLTSIKRAGADLIITYWAKEIARWLKQ